MTEEANNPTPPTPVEHASDSTPPSQRTPEDFYLVNRMRVCACIECGELFAVSLRFFQQRAKANAEIICPAGHANSTFDDANRWPKLTDVVRGMERELAQARHDRDVAVRALASVPAGQTPVEKIIDQDELDKRVRFIAAAADDHRKCCQFCGTSLKNQTQQRRHLRRNHLEQIRKLPASQFDTIHT